MSTIASAQDDSKCISTERPSLSTASMMPLALTAIAFFVFGLLLTVNSQITSGGTWPLYAMLMDHGARLYSDLHLPQQPLFLLFNRIWYAIAGDNWLLSQAPPALLLALFCNGYFRISRRIPGPSWQKATIFFGSSMVAIGWQYYSFFDYRVFTDIISLYAVILLLRLNDRNDSPKISIKWPVILGSLCGLSFSTRANDGLMLLIAVGAILFHWFPRQFPRNAVLLLVTATVTVLLVVLMTGERLDTYFEYTLHSAPEMKGGAGQVILSPLLLVIDIFRYLSHPLALIFDTLSLVTVSAPAAAVAIWTDRKYPLSKRDAIILISALVPFEVGCLFLLKSIPYSAIYDTALPCLQIFLLILSIRAALSVIGIVNIRNRLGELVLIPGGALLAAGMSSGGDHLGIFGPIGLLLILLPATAGEAVTYGKRAFILAVCVLLGIPLLVGKVHTPMQWQHYRAKPMFVDRKFVEVSSKGPMLVERDMDGFFSDVCRTIKAQGLGNGLLSLPYSYSNYYCGITPWRMYVQTYFDTSSAGTIDDLMQALDSAPPTWIVYQRQLDYLRATELAFNHGQPIRHRALDRDIWNHIERHKWTIVRHWSDQPDDDWYLIRTAKQ